MSGITRGPSNAVVKYGDKAWDGEFSQKRVGKNHVCEMFWRKDGGAMIRMWQRANDIDRVTARKLQHIYHISEDGEWLQMDEVHFMHSGNAREEWSALSTVRAMMDLALRNS